MKNAVKFMKTICATFLLEFVSKKSQNVYTLDYQIYLIILNILEWLLFRMGLLIMDHCADVPKLVMKVNHIVRPLFLLYSLWRETSNIWHIMNLLFSL